MYFLIRCSWVKKYQTVYRQGSIVIREVHDDMPIFSKVECIFCTVNKEFYLIVKDLLFPEYYSHFHCYIFSQTNENDCSSIQLININQLKDHHTYQLHQTFDQQLSDLYFICLKYNLIND